MKFQGGKELFKNRFSLIVLSVSLLIGMIFTTYPADASVYAESSYNDLENAINTVMTDSRMVKAVSSVTVRKASNGEIIYQSQGDKGITPASTLKILTAASALETLGEDYRFTTDVLTNGQVKNGTLDGNLYLRGGRSNVVKEGF